MENNSQLSKERGISTPSHSGDEENDIKLGCFLCFLDPTVDKLIEINTDTFTHIHWHIYVGVCVCVCVCVWGSNF